jgi:symmetrical bis(5'-nucleosyl)-tetraphosphatase
VLRFVRALGDNAIVVLGNHDLHLLALAHDKHRKRRSGDTLDAIFDAPDCDAILEWLLHRPLAHLDAEHGDLMVHAGVVPQWSAAQTVALAADVSAELARDARLFFKRMYGDRPDQWSDALSGMERLRFTVNALTRMRLCTADGRIDLKMKGPPGEARHPYRPWFEHELRKSRDVRIIFGHWSALGLVQAHGVVGLDTGCVWSPAATSARAPANNDLRGRKRIDIRCKLKIDRLRATGCDGHDDALIGEHLEHARTGRHPKRNPHRPLCSRSRLEDEAAGIARAAQIHDERIALPILGEARGDAALGRHVEFHNRRRRSRRLVAPGPVQT